MNFITPNYLDAILMRTPDSINKLAGVLKFRSDEFLSACKSRNCEKADDILTENITRLMGSSKDSVLFAMIKLARKFPQLRIDTSYITLSKDMVLKIGEYADEMLAIAEERGVS